ncbi:MAG: KH domain-containing protein [Fimbriimonadaceae bacterium]|jgi:hypothetical protein|nr:KH domain-containing protein [Fimbriimonadaceae bacterium]
MSLLPLVEQTIKLIVNEPEAVTVREGQDKAATIFTVTVSPNDVGRVIGKDGRVITCIRQLVGAAGQKARQKTVVKVETN